MQRGAKEISHLRQKLLELYHPAREDLAPFLAEHPLVKGTVYTLRRKCSKLSCRCAQGQVHETVVLTASIAGKTRLWTIPWERIEELRERTRRYRLFRQARSRLLKACAKRQAEMRRLIDAIERIRTRTP